MQFNNSKTKNTIRNMIFIYHVNINNKLINMDSMPHFFTFQITLKSIDARRE